MKNVNILAFQYHPIYLDIAANLRKMDNLIKKNIHLHPDLVIFPEYSLTAPLYSNYHLSLKENDDVFNQLSKMAKKYNIHLIPGTFIVKKNKDKYNSTCLINNQGVILDFYNKQKLWSSEKRFLQAGKRDVLFKTNIGNIATQICADLHSSSISDNYRSLSPDIIVNLAMWAQEDINSCSKKVPLNIEYNQTELLARARAIENRCYFVFCNFANKVQIKSKTGRVYKETSIGNSMIINPYGEVIAKADDNGEQFLFAQIDVKKTKWNKYNH